MDLGIAGKVALVCGGSAGLGRGCAAALAAEGVVVAIAARDEARLREATGSLRAAGAARAAGFQTDLDDAAAREQLVTAVRAELGDIDILVTNNGGPPAGGIDQVAYADFNLALNRNLLSAIHLCGLVLPSMRARKWGRVVHVASISVKQPIAGLLLSNTARVGLAGYTKSVSAEIAADGVLMHVVCPGSHDTVRIRQLAATRAAAQGLSEEAALAAMVREIPVGRLGQPRELGALVAFLSSELAAFMTGTVIQVDGGACRGLL
ncbi:MAG: SDR family oxidoreductase [Candidatus Schekmanbacteria bacterium]|nr:SDR family oxidoreductase [Candidatus Schekmanbacteria bacterium]